MEKFVKFLDPRKVAVLLDGWLGKKLFTIFPSLKTSTNRTAGSIVPGTLMRANGQCAESFPMTPRPKPLGRSSVLRQPQLTAPNRRLYGSGRVTIILLLKART